MLAVKEQILLDQLQDPRQKEAAFSLMVREYQRMLYYHIRRMVIDHEDADDVLQNTFLKAWRYLDKFRGDSALRTWLYRIATNEALTHLNQRKKRNYQDVETLEDDLQHSQGQAVGPDGDEIQHRLGQAIALLPERQRAVFNMRYYDELKYDEISKILEVSVGALKASYHHAVKKIEKYLCEND
jgi:RNA polymerase sigma-70 factor (ECF subfamily)